MDDVQADETMFDTGIVGGRADFRAPLFHLLCITTVSFFPVYLISVIMSHKQFFLIPFRSFWKSLPLTLNLCLLVLDNLTTTTILTICALRDFIFCHRHPSASFVPAYPISSHAYRPPTQAISRWIPLYNQILPVVCWSKLNMTLLVNLCFAKLQYTPQL